jgi:uncharacterized protein RhaS with RHS repeats
MNRDPLGEEGGINFYGFVQNDPVNWIDPDGLRGNSFNFSIRNYLKPQTTAIQKAAESAVQSTVEGASNRVHIEYTVALKDYEYLGTSSEPIGSHSTDLLGGGVTINLWGEAQNVSPTIGLGKRLGITFHLDDECSKITGMDLNLGLSVTISPITFSVQDK